MKVLRILLSLAAAGLTGPAFAAKDELVIGLSQEIEGLNPLPASMLASAYAYRLVGRSLVVPNADVKWVPQLAKSIPSLDNGGARLVGTGDQKKVIATWELADGASWGDGQPVTCEDFKFALEVASSPTVAVGEKNAYDQVEKIEWDSKTPKKCVFTYRKANWDFWQSTKFYPLPKHLEGPVWNKHGREKAGYEHNSLYVKQPTNPGLYNGPYVVTELKPGSHLSFASNPRWHGEKPKIRKITIKLIPNTGTLEANLRSGTIDLIPTLGFTLDQALTFEKKAKAEKWPYVVQYQPSTAYEHVALKAENPILRDVRVRRALLHAINREDLVRSLFENKQPVARSFIPPRDPWSTADVRDYRYSRRDAQKLLDEAGWKMGKDGIRTKDGQRLSFVFMTTAGNKTREMVQAYLQSQWKQAGIEVVIKNEPAKVFFGDTLSKRRFTGMTMSAWISAPETTPWTRYHSSAIPSEKNGWSGSNYEGWSHPEADRLLESLEQEFNPATRAELAARLQKLYAEELPELPLYNRVDIAVTPKDFKGYRLTGHNFPETNAAEFWAWK